MNFSHFFGKEKSCHAIEIMFARMHSLRINLDTFDFTVYVQVQIEMLCGKIPGILP